MAIEEEQQQARPPAQQRVVWPYKRVRLLGGEDFTVGKTDPKNKQVVATIALMESPTPGFLSVVIRYVGDQENKHVRHFMASPATCLIELGDPITQAAAPPPKPKPTLYVPETRLPDDILKKD